AAAHGSLGLGFWSFSIDSVGTLQHGQLLADGGVRGIVAASRDAVPSVAFVQVLAVAEVLFGAAASLGLLLNCGCFLAGALLLRRWVRAAPWTRGPALLALAVWSLQPTWVLWATQVLKEAFVGLLFLAWLLSSRAWLAVTWLAVTR